MLFSIELKAILHCIKIDHAKSYSLPSNQFGFHIDQLEYELFHAFCVSGYFGCDESKVRERDVDLQGERHNYIARRTTR